MLVGYDVDVAKRRRRGITMKWKNFGFIPEGFDDSRMIRYRDKGFLFLCRQLRYERTLPGYTIRDLKFRPGQSGSCSTDWTGFDDALFKAGPDVPPPDIAVKIIPRTLSTEERDDLGRQTHRVWVAVQEQQRAAGKPLDDAELRPWDELPDETLEIFRRGGEAFALSEEAMWDAINQQRKLMGEFAFRMKLFEICVSIAMERMLPHRWTEAERQVATYNIVKLAVGVDDDRPLQPLHGWELDDHRHVEVA